ncbi:MAG: sodium:proton exchanger [Planctomycetes bacterium RBG_13_46_10]|nr:MAG: sodium:proton exchanger [Planctomycetes bacterium RBG_13_46_10]
MVTYVLLIIGFALLIKGASLLVDGASSIARIFNVSDLVAGLTIVAFGTSMPELSVNIFASIKANSDIAIGNIVGSNIFNILIILGVSSLIFPLTVTKGTVWIEIPLTLLAALLLGVLANDQLVIKTSSRGLSRIDGWLFLCCFAIFLYYIFLITRKKEKANDISLVTKQYSFAKSTLMTAVGFACLFAGAKFVVDGAVDLATKLGVSQSLIALTIVAAGTSLPELATSAVAAYKKNSDIAVGNIVGSNIFNIFFILGISALIRPIALQPKSNIDIAVTVFASLILFVVMFSGKRHVLDRWEGFLFIALYIIYIAFLIVQG